MNTQTSIRPSPVSIAIDPEQLETAIRALLATQRYFLRAVTVFDGLREIVKERSIDKDEEAITATLELSARAFASMADMEGEALYQLGAALDAGDRARA